MKTTYTFILYIVALFCFSACQDGNDFGSMFEPGLTPRTAEEQTDYKIETESTLSFDAEASTVTIDVNANCSWTATVSDAWLSATSSANNTQLTVSVAENTFTEERTGLITLKGTGTITRGGITRTGTVEATIVVTQAGKQGLPEFFYEIGNESGWSVAHTLYDHDGDGVYAGYYYLDGDFMFRSNKDNWDGTILAESNASGYGSGVLIKNGTDASHNCNAESGFYCIGLDLNNMTYSLKKIESISIIGSFNGWNDDDDDMIYNQSLGCWETTVTFEEETDFKFRQDHGWDYNWGGSLNHLVLNGESYTLPAGTYKFQFFYEWEHIWVAVTQLDSPSQSITITANGVSFKMIRVDGGTFTMGATSEQGSDVYSDEKPTHRVTLSTYYLGETEVTQALWEAVMGSNPSYNKGSNLPVEQVSWEDCKEFVLKLNESTGKSFRLPTEAEWEYAARGGNKSKGYKYAGSNTIGDVAWYDDNSEGKTHAVKTKQANELGLYDMSGNVYEWCEDWYGSYSSNAQTNPKGPSSGSYRVNRGGSWYGDAGYCRVSLRYDNSPLNRYRNVGLRLAL